MRTKHLKKMFIYAISYYLLNQLHTYRKIAKTSRTYIEMSSFKIRVIFEILLNSIVCFLQFSSGYIRVRLIIKVDLFSRFYGIFEICTIQYMFKK